MATISSPGIGSGLDINGIITKLMTVEQQPLTALDKKEASYQAKLSAFGTLKSAVATLESKAFSLKSASLYSGKSSSSSDTTVVTTSANTAATAGSYNVQVVDLAQAHTVASQVFTSLTDDIGGGKIKIELGTFTGGVYTPGTTPAAKTISIAASNSSLSDIRDAINSASAGVKASIVNVGENQYKLTLTSTSLGSAQSIRLTTTDDSDVLVTNNTGIGKFSFDPTSTANNGKEFDVTAIAQDAHIKVDGVDLYRTSNTIADAITGVTLTAIKAGTSTVKVTANTEAVTTAFSAFVSAYNEINTQLRDMTAYDKGSKTAALLLGDAGARSLQGALRGMVTSAFAGGGSIKRLSDLGVSLQRDGSLEFTSSKLTSALSADPASVINAMTSTTVGANGLAVSMNTQLKALISDGGLISGKTDGIESSIADITKQRERLGLRLTQIEARYRKQFTALDTMVASMQQTSQYLTQQLASLSANSSK